LADDELDEIWLHIAQDNESVADNMIHKTFYTIDILVKEPLMGRMREEIRPQIRSFAVAPYIIFYRLLPNVIEILRVLHGARDIDAMFH